jgi:hypothetical protein
MYALVLLTAVWIQAEDAGVSSILNTRSAKLEQALRLFTETASHEGIAVPEGLNRYAASLKSEAAESGGSLEEPPASDSLLKAERLLRRLYRAQDMLFRLSSAAEHYGPRATEDLPDEWRQWIRDLFQKLTSAAAEGVKSCALDDESAAVKLHARFEAHLEQLDIMMDHTALLRELDEMKHEIGDAADDPILSGMLKAVQNEAQHLSDLKSRFGTIRMKLGEKTAMIEMLEIERERLIHEADLIEQEAARTDDDLRMRMETVWDEAERFEAEREWREDEEDDEFDDDNRGEETDEDEAMF